MIDEIRIIDRVYLDPDSVREYALAQPFESQGNFPGYRTAPASAADRELLKTTLEAWLTQTITHWPQKENTCYQLCLEGDQTWVHHDKTEWAGVLFLTPDDVARRAEEEHGQRHGIGFYRKRGTENSAASDWIYDGEGTVDWNQDSAPEDWETIVEVSGLYNRLVAFRAGYYHRSLLPGFGDAPETGRLTQVFFWNVS